MSTATGTVRRRPSGEATAAEVDAGANDDEPVPEAANLPSNPPRWERRQSRTRLLPRLLQEGGGDRPEHVML
jgi:hypothetical protein